MMQTIDILRSENGWLVRQSTKTWGFNSIETMLVAVREMLETEECPPREVTRAPEPSKLRATGMSSPLLVTTWRDSPKSPDHFSTSQAPVPAHLEIMLPPRSHFYCCCGANCRLTVDGASHFCPTDTCEFYRIECPNESKENS